MVDAEGAFRSEDIGEAIMMPRILQMFGSIVGDMIGSSYEGMSKVPVDFPLFRDAPSRYPPRPSRGRLWRLILVEAPRVVLGAIRFTSIDSLCLR